MIRKGVILKETYEVLEKIGEGSGGEVYRGVHLGLQKEIVIKKVKNLTSSAFDQKEANILKRLHHSNIPQVYDFIRYGNDVFTVMEYIDGNTMQEYIDAGVFFQEAQIVHWLLQLLDALKYMHSQRPPVIHNDIKPNNIMIGRSGKIYLIDFNVSYGDSNYYGQGGFTKAFASPEQLYRQQLYISGQSAEGIQVDARSDIFSLAASFYNLMTGEKPRQRVDLGKPLWDPNRRYPYSEPLREVITVAMRRNPNRRYQTAGQMILALRSMKKKDRTLRKLQRSRTVYSLIFGVTAALGAVCMLFGWRTMRDERYADEVQKIEDTWADGNYKQVIRQGENLLSDQNYAISRSREQTVTAQLHYYIGDALFEESNNAGDYQEAADSFAQAAALDEHNPVYYRDYVIALDKGDETEEAEKALTKAERKFGSSLEITLAGGEMALQKGNEEKRNGKGQRAAQEFEKAVRDFSEVISKTSDEKTLEKAYLWCSEAYEGLGEEKKQIRILERAVKNSSLSDVQTANLERSLSNAYIKAINEDDADADAYAEKCERILTKLVSDTDNVSVNDNLNLARLYWRDRKYEQALDLLGKAEKQFPTEYQIPKLETLICESAYTRKDRRTKAYYRQAENLYRNAKKNGTADSEMEELEQRMNA